MAPRYDRATRAGGPGIRVRRKGASNETVTTNTAVASLHHRPQGRQSFLVYAVASIIHLVQRLSTLHETKMIPLRIPENLRPGAIPTSLPAWLTSWGRHGANGALTSADGTTSIVELPNLPGEIILMIMEHLEPPTLLSFSLTCYNCYQLALPLLSQVLVVTPQNYRVNLKRLTSDSYLNQFIRRVQIGSQDTFDLGGDDFHLDTDFYDILSSLPTFQELIIRDAELSVGWDGVNMIGGVLADKLRALQVRIIVPLGIPYDLNVSFPHLHTLDLRIMPIHGSFALERMFPDAFNLIGSNCPSLTCLKIYFPASFHPHSQQVIFPLIRDNSRPLFPHLSSFHLWYKIGQCSPLSQGNAFTISRFLTAHSSTLRELSLPPWLPTAPLTPQPRLSLRLLRCSQSLAWQLASPSNQESVQSVEELTLDSISSAFNGAYTPFKARKANSVDKLQTDLCFKSVRKLVLIVERQPDKNLTFRCIPEIFPGLEDLKIDFTSVLYPARVNRSWNREQGSILRRAEKLKRVTVATPSMPGPREEIYVVKRSRYTGASLDPV